jgi:hypothetical protein
MSEPRSRLQVTCQRQLLAAHLKDECVFTKEQCPDPDCSRKVLRKDILGDNSLCPHRPVVCHGCGTELKGLELGVSTVALIFRNIIGQVFFFVEHLQSETVAHAVLCLAAIVACEQVSYEIVHMSRFKGSSVFHMHRLQRLKRRMLLRAWLDLIAKTFST